MKEVSRKHFTINGEERKERKKRKIGENQGQSIIENNNKEDLIKKSQDDDIIP